MRLEQAIGVSVIFVFIKSDLTTKGQAQGVHLGHLSIPDAANRKQETSIPFINAQFLDQRSFPWNDLISRNNLLPFNSLL